MKLPLSWIKEFIDINLSVTQIAKLLTQAGLEVESFSLTSLSFEKVVVADVIKVEKHPNADTLSVALVADGTREYQVVCGAPNCRVGIKTAFAIEGAKLQDESGKEFKVKRTKLRGVESYGMLCSEKELGLGEKHEGIMEFADHIKEGTSIAQIYADTIFEIALTPNLGHCASVLGVARELSAITNLPIKRPKIAFHENSESINDLAKVTILDSDKCPRYACRIIRDVQIRQSPEWLQKRLIACGMRPINNVVDVTNLVLMELGHPLHAFDYNCLDGHQIIVRHAEDRELFIALDGKELRMSIEDLMICDKEKAVAIAGVVGGQNSEVTDQTKHILLEVAYFQSTTIRRTSKRHGLQTEASRRFERGCDPNQIIDVLNRAAMLIQELAGGRVCSGVIDIKKREFPPKVVQCRLSRISCIIGISLSLNEIEAILQSLKMNYKWDGQDTFIVSVPTFRVDIQSEIDLIEEVARIYGFDNIPKRVPHFVSSNIPHTPIFLFEKKIRSHLIAQGLQEFVTCDLIGPTLLDAIQIQLMPEDLMIKVINPTSIEQSILRTSLMPGLLQAVKFNYDRENHDITAFEVGRIHFKKEEQYKEQSVVGIILIGKNRHQHWDRKPSDIDFFDLKGIIENLLIGVGGKDLVFQPSQLSLFHPGRQAGIFGESLRIGTLGEVHPAILRRLDIPKRVFFAEIDLQDLFQIRKKDFQMQDLSIYPGSSRDLTITLKESTSIQTILNIIQDIPSLFLEEVTVGDLFRSERIGKGYKNVTFHFIYRDKTRTISQKDVDIEHTRITARISLLHNQEL
jgi:phenylalanyl-tRNA synthetase beta chain